MKKLIIICLFAFVASAVNAQYGTPYQMPVVAGDTLVNTDNATKIFTVTAGYNCIAIQPVVTKISGTVAGTVVLYGTVDGTNYVSLGDTLTCTNQATNTDIFVKTNAPYYKYKLYFSQTGTDSTKIKVWIIERKTAVVISQ